jgi:hypothetical protein
MKEAMQIKRAVILDPATLWIRYAMNIWTGPVTRAYTRTPDEVKVKIDDKQTYTSNCTCMENCKS